MTPECHHLARWRSAGVPRSSQFRPVSAAPVPVVNAGPMGHLPFETLLATRVRSTPRREHQQLVGLTDIRLRPARRRVELIGTMMAIAQIPLVGKFARRRSRKSTSEERIDKHMITNVLREYRTPLSRYSVDIMESELMKPSNGCSTRLPFTPAAIPCRGLRCPSSSVDLSGIGSNRAANQFPHLGTRRQRSLTQTVLLRPMWRSTQPSRRDAMTGGERPQTSAGIRRPTRLET
jgi:hypothetical protein